MVALVINGAAPAALNFYGDGDGYGDGYGYGYGYASKQYWIATIDVFAEKWTDAQRARLNELRNAGATIAFWRSNAEGSAANGGRNAPVSVGTVEKIKGPLALCGRGALHATFIPPKWKGERYWVVALLGEIAEEDDKVGALEREVIGECL